MQAQLEGLGGIAEEIAGLSAHHAIATLDGASNIIQAATLGEPVQQPQGLEQIALARRVGADQEGQGRQW